MSKEAAQTIHGNYHVVVAPDGQLVTLTKLSDGTWALTADRLKDDDQKKKTTDQIAFDKSFENTKTIPNDFVKQDTNVLTPDVNKMQKSLEGTRNRMDAFLGEMLGNPDDIISGTIKVNPDLLVRHKSQCVGLIETLNSPKWNRVKEIIWK